MAGKKIKEGTLVEWKSILKNKEIDILFSEQQLKNFIKKIGNDIDKEGFIIDPETNERILSNDSSEINIKELGAILPSSKEFIKGNIASFSQYLAEKEP